MFLNQYYKPIRCSVFIASAVPAIDLIHRYISNSLGVNPFATLSHTTGHLTMFFIIVTLAITPLRRWLTWLFACMPSLRWGKRLSDWNILIKLRRMLGIYSFFYGSIHLWVYCYLEMGWYWEDLYVDVQERYFLLWGLLAWCCLLLLTITSLNLVIKTMGVWWRRLHRLMYFLAVFSVLHYYFFAKVTDQQPLWYGLAVCILLSHRLIFSYIRKNRRSNDNGMEVSRE